MGLKGFAWETKAGFFLFLVAVAIFVSMDRDVKSAQQNNGQIMSVDLAVRRGFGLIHQSRPLAPAQAIYVIRTDKKGNAGYGMTSDQFVITVLEELPARWHTNTVRVNRGPVQQNKYGWYRELTITP